ALTLALTSASSSPWYSRRSEWPTATYLTLSLASCAPETSPVYAPDVCADRSCAPRPISSLSASMRVWTERIEVNDGSTATSTWEKSCLASWSSHASFCTACVASRWSRLSFQLPAMSGVRVMCPYPSSTDRPGRTLPSSSSSDAPPPVEMWPKPASSKPRRRTAAAESPPPTTENPSLSTMACATARVPPAKATNSNTPLGPVPTIPLATASL